VQDGSHSGEHMARVATLNRPCKLIRTMKVSNLDQLLLGSWAIIDGGDEHIYSLFQVF
jgi:hypothetical protein